MSDFPTNEVRIPAGRATLDGNLTIIDQASTLVLFVHGSGSSRHSPRNQFVARTLNEAGLATLLFDLLTPEEEEVDLYSREHRFNISLLAERLVYATKWAKQRPQMRDLRVGYFGSSTGGGAALGVAAQSRSLADAVLLDQSAGLRPGDVQVVLEQRHHGAADFVALDNDGAGFHEVSSPLPLRGRGWG